jgi:hypothetical protein
MTERCPVVVILFGCIQVLSAFMMPAYYWQEVKIVDVIF